MLGASMLTTVAYCCTRLYSLVGNENSIITHTDNWWKIYSKITVALGAYEYK